MKIDRVTIRLSEGINLGDYEVAHPELELSAVLEKGEDATAAYAALLQEMTPLYQKLAMNLILSSQKRRAQETPVGQVQAEVREAAPRR